MSIWGWERDNEQFALVYHPFGHASPFLKRWLETFASLPPAPAGASILLLRSQLEASSAGGACVKCHAGMQPDLSRSLPRWASAPAERTFVRFSHRPHLLEPALKSCVTCHSLPGTADANDFALTSSGFRLIAKETCAACHANGAASDSCLTCHNYHVTPPAPMAAVH